MSNTPSSQPSADGDHSNREFVREIVTRRAGRRWCLFLDRDGVINRQIVGDYVRNWSEFVWLPGTRSALRKLRQWAPYIVVVTNQQGIGKGLMTVEDVAEIHRNVVSELAEGGVTLDAIRLCPHLESQGCECRKPRVGLIRDWLVDHPDSDPLLSVMVGDSLSDLELARNVATSIGGCVSIRIGHRDGGAPADAVFESLLDFAIAIEAVREEQGL